VSSAREAVLDRIRAALGAQPATPHVPRDYRQAGSGGVELFCERVADYVATVHRVREADLDAVLASLVSGRVVAAPGFKRPGVTADGPHIAPAELDGFDAALTGCALAIAETGTIVLDGGLSSGRRALTLVPDHHICVVRAEQIVAGVPEAIEALAEAARDRRPITFVSGPSATSDIELERVEGVHGPRKLDVLVVSA
jgi:L-lactate dehydrogenase complex protein LldG